VNAPPTALHVDALLFDSDGVLVDSHAQVDVAWRALADEFTLDFSVLASQLVGVPARQTLARHLAGPRLDAAVDRLEDLEVETAATTSAVSGAPELLAALPARSWAVVTSATRRLGRARWAGAGIPMPTFSITADDVPRGKPAPDPYLAGAGLLGASPSRCVVFEDSAAGGDAAVAAGAAVVAVGDQAWRVVAHVRIPDLTGVRVEAAPGRGLLVTFATGSVSETA
jgi:mannitol-1-/sugar-/sorbitol-6-phosphatase